jgi:hypothetical protein
MLPLQPLVEDERERPEVEKIETLLGRQLKVSLLSAVLFNCSSECRLALSMLSKAMQSNVASSGPVLPFEDQRITERGDGTA